MRLTPLQLDEIRRWPDEVVMADQDRELLRQLLDEFDRLRKVETTAEAVAHELAHGEAGEGDPAGLAWCARELGRAVSRA